MAQTNFTPILTYGSTTAASVPLAANLTTSANGVELAVNATDGKLFYKDNAGIVQVLASKASAQGGVTSVSVATANGMSGSSSGGATPALTLVVGAINLATATGLPPAGVTGTAAILGANTFTGEQIVKETQDTVHTITDGAAFAIDPVNGNIQVVTLGASRSPTATNFAAGQAILMGIDDGSAFTITWPSVTWLKSGGTGVPPTLATTGYTWVMLFKQGSTLFGTIVGSP